MIQHWIPHLMRQARLSIHSQTTDRDLSMATSFYSVDLEPSSGSRLRQRNAHSTDVSLAQQFIWRSLRIPRRYLRKVYGRKFLSGIIVWNKAPQPQYRMLFLVNIDKIVLSRIKRKAKPQSALAIVATDCQPNSEILIASYQNSLT